MHPRRWRTIAFLVTSAIPLVVLAACSQADAHPPPLEDCTLPIGCDPVSSGRGTSSSETGDASGNFALDGGTGTEDAALSDGNFPLDAGPGVQLD